MFQQIKIFAKAQFSAFTGGVCDYLIMIFLTEFAGVHYMLSIAIACILGAVINFSLNKTWTFLSKRFVYKFPLLQQLWRFVLVLTGSIVLKMLGTYFITSFLHIDYKISRILSDLIVSLCFNYVLQRYWVFKNT
jgi:putative flippase GtrA